MINRVDKHIFVVVVLVFWVVGSASGGLTDPLQNGDFSNGLNFWVPEGNVIPLTFSTNDLAYFQQDNVSNSFLRQAFLLPTDASMIDITFTMNGTNSSPGSPYDSFQGFLRDPVTLDPISHVAGEDFFFLRNTTGSHEVHWDISGYGGQNVLLEFGFFSDSPSAGTYVLLDEVSITGGYSPPPAPVPAPFSVLLCATGVTLVTSFRKRFI